jgi:hypothetical protein
MGRTKRSADADEIGLVHRRGTNSQRCVPGPKFSQHARERVLPPLSPAL